jgi:Pyruvate/2-oxoacid:ferredoxin oxidoreductase delta subunit
MARPLWFVELIKKTFPQRKLIAQLTHVPIIGRIIDKMLFEGDDIIYLPKDSTVRRRIQVDMDLEQPVETALPSEIVHRFIDEANFHWRMNFCICRESAQCEDYPIDYGCLFLGEAAKEINPDLGKQITKEEAHEHIRKCGEVGLVHMVGRNKLDAMWLGVGPGKNLMSICNCCPCCCLWRVLPSITPDIGRKVTKMPGVNVTVTDECVGCGLCTQDVCFTDAIKMVNGKAAITDACRGCGRCVEICPHDAIELTIDRPDRLEESHARISRSLDLK